MVFVGIRSMYRLQLRSVRVMHGLELSLRAVSLGGVHAGHLQQFGAQRLDFLIQAIHARLLHIHSLAPHLRKQQVAH
jgi:hypothetical protein